jgi:hypothetical protein
MDFEQKAAETSKLGNRKTGVGSPIAGAKRRKRGFVNTIDDQRSVVAEPSL